MSTEKLWVMRCPVISTAHIPGPDSLQDLQFTEAASVSDLHPIPSRVLSIYEEPADISVVEWFKPIRAWLESLPEDVYNGWLRFDADGDVIDGLPVFDW